VRVAPESSSPEPLDGERKTVTALFADIKGSTELMEDLDPEEARAIIDPALKLMIDAARRYDGYVVQSTGDGIFALFGAPVAHEDHPQRALYAALRMQEELKCYSDRIRQEGRLPLQARVGVNTGEVVVRSIQTGAHTEYTPIGHTANLAARMQVLAPIGSIAATEQVRKLCEGYFLFNALGPTKVKGVAEPVNVYEVTGLGPLRTRLQRSAGRGLTKFVGREREMEALKHAGEQARSGHGQIAAAMAEPGVGKSRLFYEFKATSQSGWIVLETFSVSHGKASAYLPIIDLLRNYFRIANEDDERTRREKVAGKITILDRTLEDTLPYIYGLLGIVEGDDLLAQMDGQIKKRRTLEAIKRILLRESLNQPLMVIFEDLHWIDEQTQELLNLLADSIGTAKFLLLVNYRPEYSHQWNSKTYYTQLRLDPLGRENAEEMLSALLGDGKDLIPLKRLIIERTEGTPFFMEETVLVLLDEGALARNGTVKLTKSLNELKIPPTVQAILAARIDRLPPDEKELLQTLAVLGKEFTLSHLKATVARSDSELERMLADLQMAEFVYEQPATGDIEYTFKHALTQDVAYNSVLIDRRKLLHGRAGQALESMFAEQLDDHLGELAHHYSHSDNVGKAVEYLGRAGQQALQRSAYADAIAYFTTALQLLTSLPDTRERAQRELALQIALGAPLMNTRGFAAPEVGQAYTRARDLCQSTGATAQLPVALRGLWEFYEVRAEYQTALELGEQLLALAQSLNDPALLVAAYSALGDTLLWLGQFTASRNHCERGIALYDPRWQKTHVVSHGYALDVTCRCFGALALWYLGYPDRALTRSREAIGRARELAHPFTLAAALLLSDWLGMMRRDRQPISDESEAIALMTEQGFAFALAFQTVLRGSKLVDEGQAEEGITAIRWGIDASEATGATQLLPFFHGLLAKAYGKTGRADEGLELLDQALAQMHKTNERFCEAELHRFRGELLQIQDRAYDADACFRTAIEIARGQSSRSLELRATSSLARLLTKHGKRDEARTMLAEIYGWFTEGLDTADLKDAKALLDELNA
jgi:class 3 adenylate cyclase/predicted ATPase